MIPYGMQNIDKSDIDAVVNALKADFITTGPLVEEFEFALADLVGADTFVVSSGTAALHCAFFGIGIGPGDEVITPPNTFIATQATAAILGAKIIFADIDLETGLISQTSVKEKISARTKAIVLVDYAGQPCDVDAFRELIGNRNIFLVEDAAHSFGSSYKNRPVGALADVTTFSFYPTKNITTGEGGAVSSNNPDIFKRAKRFARQGLVRDHAEFELRAEGPWHQEVHKFGLNYRLTDFQCALGLSQLRRFRSFVSKRKDIVKFYREQLNGLAEVHMLPESDHCDVVNHLFPIFVEPTLRGKLFSFLRAKGIGVQVNYFPASSHPVFSSTESSNFELPNSQRFYDQEISLPIHFNLTQTELLHITESVKKFFNDLNNHL